MLLRHNITQRVPSSFVLRATRGPASHGVPCPLYCGLSHCAVVPVCGASTVPSAAVIVIGTGVPSRQSYVVYVPSSCLVKNGISPSSAMQRTPYCCALLIRI